jgi:asparagine synthase (glutamine-hydrolysing)
MRRDNGVLLFASRVAPLATQDDYDLDYMREFLYGGCLNTSRTLWRDVVRVEPGQLYQQRGTTGEWLRHWSADRFEPARKAGEAETVAEFRSLLTASIQQRLDPAGPTWSHLSGGLDSSSIVSTSERIIRPGSINGTITMVDSMGNGDERRFSDLIGRDFGVPNVQVSDAWPWQNSGAFTLSDEPNSLYPYQDRDQRVRAVMRERQARVLLSGHGADQYLTGNLNYIPDLVVSGRWIHATRDLVSWSLANRRSFWWMAKRHAVEPLLGARLLRSSRDDDAARLPRWLGTATQVTREYARVYDFAVKPPRGRMFSYQTSREVAGLSDWILRDAFEDGMEVRYPFLSRPLVEFALRLPVEMRLRPGVRKWILREAMRGVLPEPIRTRQSKGSIGARILWSLQQEAGTLQALLRQPLLAELGLIDVHHLRTAVEEARTGAKHNLVMLMSALSLETWLAVRNGQTATQRRAA